MSVLDKVAIGVGVSLSFVLFSFLLFFLLRGKRRLKENLVKKNSTVSVNAEVNYFLIEYFKNHEQLSSRPVYFALSRKPDLVPRTSPLALTPTIARSRKVGACNSHSISWHHYSRGVSFQVNSI